MTPLSIQRLPQSIRDHLIDDSVLQLNESIQRDFKLTEEQFKYVSEGILDLILKKQDLLQFPSYVANLPNAEAVDVRALALRVAVDRLWPLADHLGDVGRLITRLGGAIPSAQPVRASHDDVSEQQQSIRGSAREVLREHRAWEELQLTKQPIHDFENALRPPTVKRWLEEYLHEMGASGSDAFKRSQFLAQSYNVSKLNEAEKENLLNFLTSYEEGKDMYWSIAEEKYLVVQAEPPKEVKEIEQKQESKRHMDELVELYKQVQENYEKQFKEMQSGLELETNKDTKKLYDVVWDALALNEVDRCLGALSLLAEKRMLLDMLKTDHRFIGIVSREIDARYGSDAKRYWKSDLSSALGQAMFWKLLLVKKLGIEENKAAILADLFRKKLGYSVSSIYLDLQTASFRFRDIAYHDRAFSFAN